MLTDQTLARGIAQQADMLRQKGVRAELPESATLLQEIEERLKRDTANQDLQRLWRMAAIADSASCGFADLWQAIRNTITDDPNAVGPNNHRYPTPTTPENIKLAALMLTNMIACRLHLGMHDERETWLLTERAMELYKQWRHPSANRWKAVVLVAQAMYHRFDALAQSMTWAHQAIRNLDAKRQPELLCIAQALVRTGDGMFKPGFMKPARPATVQAGECLYHFKD